MNDSIVVTREVDISPIVFDLEFCELQFGVPWQSGIPTVVTSVTNIAT